MKTVIYVTENITKSKAEHKIPVLNIQETFNTYRFKKNLS